MSDLVRGSRDIKHIIIANLRGLCNIQATHPRGFSLVLVPVYFIQQSSHQGHIKEERACNSPSSTLAEENANSHIPLPTFELCCFAVACPYTHAISIIQNSVHVCNV